MAGPLATVLGRILAAAGAQAAITSGGAPGRVITGVGGANARAYSRMLGEEIISAIGRKRPTKRKATGRKGGVEPEEESEPVAGSRRYFESRSRTMWGAAAARLQYDATHRRVAGPGGSVVASTAAATGGKAGINWAATLTGVAKFGSAIGMAAGLVIGFGKAIYSISANTAEASRALAKWHGGIARSVIMLDFARMFRQRELAQDVAELASAQMESLNRLEEAWQPGRTALKKGWLHFSTALADMGTAMASWRGWLLGPVGGALLVRAGGGAAADPDAWKNKWSPIGEAWSRTLWPTHPAGRPFHVPIVRAPGEAP